MQELIAALMVWIAANSPYDLPEQQPTYEIVPNLCVKLGIMNVSPCPYGGQYDPNLQRIFLDGEFKQDDPFGRAVLLHELVHYFQDISWEGGLYDTMHPEEKCRSEREGYVLQAKYLEQEVGGSFMGRAAQSSMRACRTAWAVWRRQNPFEVSPDELER